MVDQMNVIQTFPQVYGEIIEHFYHAVLAGGGDFLVKKLVHPNEQPSKEQTITIGQKTIKMLEYHKSKNIHFLFSITLFILLKNYNSEIFMFTYVI